MSTDQIIQMAREAGATPYTSRHYPNRTVHSFGPEALKRFVALVADAEAKRIHDEGMVTVGHMREQIAATRKACAQICDDLPAPESCTGIESILWDVATLACGDAIRAGVQP